MLFVHLIIYSVITPGMIVDLEFQWIQTRLAEEAEFGHAGASRMSKILDVAWGKQDGTCWELAQMIFPR